jgi:two-component system sensor histidine kinase KdpD
VLRDVRLEIDLGSDRLLLDADYTQVEQMLTNLLENAARHAPAGSTIRVTARRHGHLVELAIADEGPGIAEFERDLVFEPFRRGYGSSSSGIGLAICRAIVEAHGGSISVGVAPGGGARFVVTLPSRDDG